MYYVWELNAGNETHFFSCGLEQFEGWEDFALNIGRKPTISFSLPLKYYAVNRMDPEDYPMTGSSLDFLISKKIADILKQHRIPNIDYYESEIVRPDGDIIKDYFTINILNEIECIDWERSDYTMKKYVDNYEVPQFKKLALEHKKIPESVKLFLLGAEKLIPIVHQDIKDACEKTGVTGIKFVPVEEYRDI